MAQKRAAIRAGGQRCYVYNEGRCVYLHDVGNADRLRTHLASHGDPDDYFYSNLCEKKFAKVAAKERLAIAYELYQGDEVSVEVIVGPPLIEAELAKARWLEPQRARLAVPSGRL